MSKSSQDTHGISPFGVKQQVFLHHLSSIPGARLQGNVLPLPFLSEEALQGQGNNTVVILQNLGNRKSSNLLMVAICRSVPNCVSPTGKNRTPSRVRMKLQSQGEKWQKKRKCSRGEVEIKPSECESSLKGSRMLFHSFTYQMSTEHLPSTVILLGIYYSERDLVLN